MKYDLSGVSVCIGMPAHRDIPAETAVSLIAIAEQLMQRGLPYEIQIVCGSSIIEVARTRVANIFLKSDKTHLFWIDSDMVWTQQDFMAILALGTELECVGATYPAKTDPIQYFINLADHSNPVLEADEHGCFEMGGMGLGFTCVQRKVMEQLAEKAPKLLFADNPEPMAHIFRCGQNNGGFQGEDMAFFADVRKLGHKVHLYPDVNLGHVGSRVFRADFMNTLKRDSENASRIEAVGSEDGPRSEAA